MTTREKINQYLVKRKTPASSETIASRTGTNVETVRRIMRDHSWLNSGNGIYRAKKTSLHRVVDDSSTKLTWLYFLQHK